MTETFRIPTEGITTGGVLNSDFRVPTCKVEPIAIVGMACRLPPDISTLGDFWNFCALRNSAWSENDKSRFNNSAFWHPNPEREGRFNNKGGHYLKHDLTCFDAPFFHITSTEAKAMDPQQRFLLEVTYEAMENAGVPMEHLDGGNTAVYSANSFSDYGHSLLRDPETTPKFTATGCDPCMLANRISYFFNLKGPSITIDTACSSSITALHLACQSLRTGESSHAIVSACHLNISPDTTVSYSLSQLLSNEGKSYPFDQRATGGFGRGEGAACIILKPLSAAIEAGDNIRAIIQNTGINQDGRTVGGITVPSVASQESLIRSLYNARGLDPLETRYIEAHGTGTATGDPIEVEALSRIFGKRDFKAGPTYLGSVKSNFGHLEGVSGLISVIKAAMMLERGVILPNTNFDSPNEKLQLADRNFQIPVAITPWPKPGIRRASVNNFGLGGSNSHVILEQGPPKPIGIVSRNRYIYVLSAQSEYSARQQMTRLAMYLRKNPIMFNKDLMKNLAYTLGARRSMFPWKVAATAISSTELVEKLRSDALVPIRSSKKPMIGFIFTGQGAQWQGMGRELLSHKVFTASIIKSETIFLELGATWTLRDELLRDSKNSRLGLPHISQAVCCAVQIALVDLLHSWALQPSAVLGHSSGEVAAAYAAGILPLDSCLAIAYHRGISTMKLRNTYPDCRGAMMAVGCGETELQELLHQVKAGKAVIGCKNSPSSFTVSGDHDAIIELQELLNTRNLFNRVLKVDVAYHSPHMELVADQYKDSLGSITTASSNVKFYSSTSGGLLERPSLDGEFWSNHMTGPVLFSDALHALCSFSETVDGQRRGIEILIEIGPHSALKGPIEQTLKGASLSGNIVYVPSLVRGKDAIQTTQDLAAGILMKGYPLNITCVNLEGDANQLNQISVLANLPPYPWMHLENYWHESRISKSYRTRSNPHNDLLGSPAADFNPLEPRWRNILRLNDVPWLRDHRLLSETVFPMAGYISMAIEAALQHANVDGEEREISSIKLQQVSAKNRLILSENTGHEILLSLRPYRLGPEDQSKQWNEFVIFSCSEETGFLEHCRGLVSVQLKIKYSDQACANLTEGSEGVICSHDRNAIFGHSMEYSKLYKELKLIGVQYGPIFQGLANIQSSGYSGRARVAFPNTVKSMPLEHESTYVIHPALLDTCLQLVFPLLTTRQTGLKRLYMPTFIEEIEISCPMDQTAGHQLDLQGMLTKDSVDTPVFSISARELDTQSAKELISIKGLRLIGLSTQTSTSNEIIDPYSKLKWMPFLDMLTPSQYRSLFSSSRTIEFEERSLIRLLNRVSCYYLRNALKRISEKGGYSGTRHANLYKWIQDQVGGCSRSDSPSLGQESISNDIDEQVPEYVQQAESSGPVGQFLCRIGENLPSIIREEVEPLSLMLVDNLLERYYEELLPLKSRLYPAAASFATYLSHQLPNLRILEIGAGTGGATLPILEALSRSTNSSPPFGCYDFTDISAGFFEKAKKKLATWQDDINFRKLDIETKPSSQGFIEESYDLIIAANVLHATVNMEKTMKNVRTLLKPGGKLLLLEITSPTVTVFPFATLPGWWLGEEDFRQSGPTLSPSSWNQVLRSTGFTGIEAEIQDYPDTTEHECCMIVSSALRTGTIRHPENLTIISDSSEGISEQLCSSLRNSLGFVPEIISLESTCSQQTDSRTYIFLEDARSPLLRVINEKQYTALQRLCLARNILWVVTGGNESSIKPENSMPLGLVRSIRNEQRGLKLVVLDMDPENRLSDIEAAATISRVFSHVFGSHLGSMGPDVELEFSERDGVVRIPRFVPDTLMNETMTSIRENFLPKVQEFEESRPIKMIFEKPGVSKRVLFLEQGYPTMAPAHDEVDIQVKACGISFHDVLMSRGEIPGELGYECSGVITGVGPGVKHLTIGDRVCVLAKGTYASSIRCAANSVAKIPDGMDFTTAASIPMAFVLAYYSLVTVGNLSHGESVLIHRAAGGVGQTAIAIAKLLGAEIYATVGSPSKKQSLVDLYGIPSERIFSSRDTSFRRDILRLTHGRGLDVILNPLSGESLQETLKCLGKNGRFVDIGRRDVLNDNRLSMSPFSFNATFSAVNLDALIEDKPKLLNGILTQGIDWYSCGKLSVKMPVTIYSISQVEEALNAIGSGETMGKVVVDFRPNTQLKIIASEQSNPVFDIDASYVVAGGGGIGQSIIRWMARRGAKNFILISRNGLKSGKVQELVSELLPRGIRIDVFRGDVANDSDLERILTESSKSLPPIKGVIHTAMVLKKIFFEKMCHRDYMEVIRPKVEGAWNLHRRFRDNSLKFFIIISSGTGVVGIPGSAAYGATTTYLGALARLRASEGLPGASLDLGPVLGVGYIADQQERQNIIEENWGNKGMNEAQLFALLEATIIGKYHRSWDQECFTCLTLPPPLEPFWFADSKFAHCRPRNITGDSKRPSKKGAVSDLPAAQLLAQSKSLDEDEAIIKSSVISKFKSVLSLHEDDITPSKQVSDYGVDSLVAVEIRNWIAHEFDARLSLLEFMESSSLSDLSKRISQKSGIVADNQKRYASSA